MKEQLLLKLLKKHEMGPYLLTKIEMIRPPKEFVPSEATQELIEAYNKVHNAYVAHPLYREAWRGGVRGKAFKEFEALRSAAHSTPTGQSELVRDWLDKVGIGEYETVQDLSEGDMLKVVVHFKAHDVFLMMTGTSDSYGGDTWDHELIPVQPVQKTVNAFEPYTN